ncbi:MAG: glycogen debranching protein [Bacteroides sp.]|nr:glycogen debranching protein [Bacteroides sp.]
MNNKRISLLMTAMAGGAAAMMAAGGERTIVETDAYRWAGDTIYQNEFKAWAESPEEIRSTYKGRPGYFMPVEQTWKRKNDLTKYPVLTTENMLHQAIFNMGLDEMVNAVEPDTTLRTGKEWAGVWTRDVSYSIILSMAALQPEASMISLMKKVNKSGQIIQDTGSGGAWPISTDRMVWVLAAYEIYKVTGDRKWLETVYPIAVRSLEKDEKTVMSPHGLVKGETSFIDWREQSYPRWMQTADISQSEAMGTNVMYAAAIEATSKMASALGKKKEAEKFAAKAKALAAAIDKKFWMDDKGYYGMYTYGRDNKILNPRHETLGAALAILYDIAPLEHQKSISENAPQTPYGPAIFWPQIPDMPNYHNNALWPFVGSYWTIAQAKAGNEEGTLEGIGAVFRPAALFATNKENFNLDNGDYFTELNSSNMLWSLSGNLGITMRILFGINFEENGLRIAPFVPETLGGTRSLDNVSYRGAKLDITVNGFGSRVKKMTLNGKEIDPLAVIPASKLKGECKIVVDMDNEPIAKMAVNHAGNRKAPLTPIAWLTFNADIAKDKSAFPNYLQWNPIEYISKYLVLRDGKVVAETRETSYPALEEGEWQVIGVAGDGTQSFASEPRSNRKKEDIYFADSSYTTTLSSPELSYRPQEDLSGASKGKFVEIDMNSAPVEAVVEIPEDGVYSISVRYANGNGPVNTENKAAIRTLTLDGSKAGTVVMPHRGVANWNDWGMSNSVVLPLGKGSHTLGIIYLPEDENMNIQTNHAIIDKIVVEKFGGIENN